MLSKNFEHTVRFYEHRANGNSTWLPLVNVTLITPTDNRISLSLLFDTGASVTTLRADLYQMLGLQSWDQGHRVCTATGGGTVAAYIYTTTLEVFGKTIQCPIQLLQLPNHPLFSGLLGRDIVFKEFGFGFWENVNELYVTTNP